jgi:hypothetical protein
LFNGYFFFYDGLKHLDSYVVGTFDNILNNYAEVITKVNKKFNTHFDLYYKTFENEEIVKQIVRTQNELLNVTDYEQRVAYPSEARKKDAMLIKERLMDKKYSGCLNKCNDIYNEIIAKYK